MLSSLRRTLRRFFNKSRKINHEPINKVSLIVIILVDLFILFNVFSGLDDISRWPLSPQQAYPCHNQWEWYRQDSSRDKDYEIVSNAVIDFSLNDIPRVRPIENERAHLGSVSDVCVDYQRLEAAIATPQNIDLRNQINNVQAEIASFQSQNATIRQQYDSTLLEEIAGQPREQSINDVAAADARAEIEQNESAIAQRQTTLNDLKAELLNKPESQEFLSLLADEAQFTTVDNGFSRARFWYPSIQLFFQGLFLLPLIVLASAVHRYAQHKNYGYVALISWHLLVIFWIPLIWKLFEFLQIGFIFEWLLEIVEVLFGGLRFLLNYLNILLIPLIGFGIIKFFQKVVFNTRLQAANRVQKMRCVRCARKIRRHDTHCPHCSYAQYHNCQNCYNLTYRHLPHCKHCGTEQPLDL